MFYFEFWSVAKNYLQLVNIRNSWHRFILRISVFVMPAIIEILRRCWCSKIKILQL
jgi:hypothetical protein